VCRCAVVAVVAVLLRGVIVPRAQFLPVARSWQVTSKKNGNNGNNGTTAQRIRQPTDIPPVS
jgi:hypothetical protein